ncbi:peptidoglycan-binding protein [Streptomyces sp. NPDC054933]
MAAAPQQRLQDMLRKAQGTNGDLGGAITLTTVLSEALDFECPKGDFNEVESLAARYGKAAVHVDNIRTQIRRVSDSGIKSVLVGDTGEQASTAVRAAADNADTIVNAFQSCQRTLSALQHGLFDAQAAYTLAQNALCYAKSNTDKGGWFTDWWDDADNFAKTKAAVIEGIGQLQTAWNTAQDAGHRAASDLSKLTSEARAHLAGSPFLSPTDALVLADAANPGGPHDLNEILTENEMKRAQQLMTGPWAIDPNKVDVLLHNAKSPQEQAYILKAVAAGYNTDQVSGFADQIRGRDAGWLADHLAPLRVDNADTSTDRLTPDGVNMNQRSTGFGYATWTQGPFGTCVASSTVTARASVDPLYALQLTTGGRPGDPAFDNPEKFSERLLAEQRRVHVEGNGGANWSGMGADGSRTIADDEIGAHTGTDYQTVPLQDGASRQNVLPDVEQSVDEGKPVPVWVQGTDPKGKFEGHQMMIVGHQGDKLQIYNPWGDTTWVSEDDFVNGHMGKASAHPLDNVSLVQLPKGP